MSYGLGKYGKGDPYGIVFQNFATFPGTATVNLDNSTLWSVDPANINAVSTMASAETVNILLTQATMAGISATGLLSAIIFSTKANMTGTATGLANDQAGLGWDALDDTAPNWTEIQD